MSVGMRRAGVVVRHATPDEYDAVGRLTVDAYRADGQLTESGAGYERVLADVSSRAVDGEVLVAVDAGGTVLGAVLFARPGSRYAQLSGAGEAEFRMLAVAPAAQRRGVGEALVRACMARARENGASAIVICVRDITEKARRLYARVGFVRVPELDFTPVPGVILLALRLDLVEQAQRHREGGRSALVVGDVGVSDGKPG